MDRDLIEKALTIDVPLRVACIVTDPKDSFSKYFF
jgi:hypothetical protein